MIKLVFRLGISFCFAQLFLQAASAQDNSQFPKPVITISFSRQVIREDDCIPVQVWFTNESEHEIDRAVLNAALPGFIKISDKPCNDQSEKEPVLSDFPIKPVETKEGVSAGNMRFGEVYVRTESGIYVGDYNLLFTINYWWKTKTEAKQSFVSTEKPLKINFLGSDSIAGIPLGLAGLIVPGLLFWVTVRIFGISWSVDTVLGDKLVYSVLISFSFIALAYLLNTFTSAKFLYYLDFGSGVSFTKLGWLAVVGVGVGIIFGIVSIIIKMRRKKKERETEIIATDDKFDIIKKLLRKSSVYNPPFWKRILRSLGYYLDNPKPRTKVILKDENFFTGTLGEKGSDITVLAGSAAIRIKKSYSRKNRLKKLEQKDLLYTLFVEAQAEEKKGDSVIIDLYDLVKKKDGNEVETLVITRESDKVLQAILDEQENDYKILVIEEIDA